MQSKSLGLIETKGFAVGIEAADAALKAANVEFLGYELSKGGGWTTIKLQGEVGAVKAAVDTARSVAMKTDSLVSAYVIARPSNEAEKMVCTLDTQFTETPAQTSELREESLPTAVSETAISIVEPTVLSGEKAASEERDIPTDDAPTLGAESREVPSESFTESDAIPEPSGETTSPDLTAGTEEPKTEVQSHSTPKSNNSGKPGRRKRN